MPYEAGDIKTFNPQKEISREIILEILIRHRDAFKQARTGELVTKSMDELKDNDRKLNQVRALNLIIAAQREMITTSRPMIIFRSTKAWEKEFKDDQDRYLNPFDKFECDYLKLLDWLKFLQNCSSAIIEAERTPALDDDFMIIEVKPEGDVNKLTENFFEMLEDLEESYEQIYLLMLVNKIVSSGIEEDEELTYKQKEEEFINRITNA